MKILEKDEINKVRWNTAYCGEWEVWGNMSKQKMLMLYPLTWGTALLGCLALHVLGELSH